MQDSSTVRWKSPSNIALVKYWGKHGRQLPANPSVSLTLSQAYTDTQVKYDYHSNAIKEPKINFLFEGKPMPAFEQKVRDFLLSIKDVYPLIMSLDLEIESSNSFPHSSGIASSASAMSALAMCLLDIEKTILGEDTIDLQKASLIARLGSGSASRSVYPKIAAWGKSEFLPDSSDEYAVPCSVGIDKVFHSFHDDILIVSREEKKVSSRAGHALMNDNPYSAARFSQARQHMGAILDSMEKGDLESFGAIVEKEALTLHALMMSSTPPYMLMEANSIHIIKAIQSFRQDTGTKVYFTLDAGPNIHMLYPAGEKEKVAELRDSLLPFCYNETIIEDHVGDGPVKLL
ncbi:MAG: diphosphomevalonate decarboxylase [Chitinophagia bacterium]|nr:diphosphomevalonate decarboxylase [Chitinophagia bacterium]